MTMPWDREDEPAAELELKILQAGVAPQSDGSYDLLLRTSRGDITGDLLVCEGQTGAVIFCPGRLGSPDGPAGGLYTRLRTALAETGVSTLRPRYRWSGSSPYEGDDRLDRRFLEGMFDECVLDVMAAVSFLKGIGAERVVLVGHSWGGGVAIRVAELSPIVCAVAGLASHEHGTENVALIAPRPLLLVHGMDDQEIYATASEEIYQRAAEPKRLVLFAGAGHGLAQCKDELFELLREWIPAHAAPRRGEG